jgi:transketolase
LFVFSNSYRFVTNLFAHSILSLSSLVKFSALYATLSERGYFSKELLDGFYIDGGKLPGHLDKDAVPGVEVSSGSLGHGLSIGVGMAIANKIDKLDNHVYVMCGDGELNEGSIWEAIMFAPHKNLDNLTMIVDYNKLQGYGKTNEVINLEPLNEKLKSFNWEVIEIDGHNLEEIEKALISKSNKPKAIIAHTVKGKSSGKPVRKNATIIAVPTPKIIS